MYADLSRYWKYQVSNRETNGIQQAVYRFPNNYGAEIWRQKGMLIVNTIPIKFSSSNTDLNHPKFGPYMVDLNTGVTDHTLKCNGSVDIDNVFKKIINLP